MTATRPSLPPSRFRFADLALVPCMLSLARVPLAAVFALNVGRPWLAFGVLVATGLTDVLDGYFARKWNQVTETGSALDGVTDKLFALTAAVAMLVSGQLSLAGLALLSVREIMELVLLGWLSVSEQARLADLDQPMANRAGKLATALQFAVVSAALFGVPYSDWLALAPALAGAYAGGAYIRDTIVLVRRGDPGLGPSIYRSPRRKP